MRFSWIVILLSLVGGTAMAQPPEMPAMPRVGPQSGPDETDYHFPIRELYIGAEGYIHIVLANGTQIEPAAEPDQVAVASAVVAPDRATAGWLVESPNCCTSYPIPLQLVIYRYGHVIQRFSSPQMITAWTFRRDGKEIAYCRDMLHGPSVPSCERADIATGRVIAAWSGSDEKPAPTWSRRLLKQRSRRSR